MKEDNLAKIAYEVDDFISLMIEKHKMDPLHLGAIMIARMMLVNQYVGSDSDFRKLIENIPNIKPKTVEVMH